MPEHYSETLYSEIAGQYDETRWQGKGAFIDSLQKELLYRILKQCGIKKGSKILDVGAGTGRLVIPFAGEGYDTYGIDIAEDMLQVARDKAEDMKNLHLEVADARKMPFADDHFDFITSYRVLIHIPEYEVVLKEMFRLLKLGGYAVFEFNNKYSLSGVARIVRRLRRVLGKPVSTDTQVVSVSALSRSLANAGFAVEKIHHQFFISEVVFRYLPEPTLKFLKGIDKVSSGSFLGGLSTRFIVLAKKP